MWHEVERLFNANDPISPDSRDALARTRVRFRGGGLDAAFKGARSPDREREELDDCEPVVWDKQAVDMEEEYGDDLRTLRHLEERLAHDELVCSARRVYAVYAISLPDTRDPTAH